MVKKSGLSKPVLLYKHAAQSLYSKTKGGVDGSTEYHEKVSVAGQLGGAALEFERKFVFRSINTVAFNAGIVYRILQKRTALEAENNAEPFRIRAFRNSLAKVESMQDFMYWAGLELCREASNLAKHNALAPTGSLNAEARGNNGGNTFCLPDEEVKRLQQLVPRKLPLAFFNSKEGQDLR
jgi:hypothetical protein